MTWIDAVFNRQESDVAYVEELRNKGWHNMTEAEREQWRSGLKGAFNASDRERIINNMLLLADVLEIDISFPDFDGWYTDDFQQAIVDNANAIRAAYVVRDDTPETPTLPLNTYQKINDIEKILNDVYTILMSNFYHYCGMPYYAGDEIGLLL